MVDSPIVQAVGFYAYLLTKRDHHLDHGFVDQNLLAENFIDLSSPTL
jgi:hypothetical protein